jgi:hypothetical protein
MVSEDFHLIISYSIRPSSALIRDPKPLGHLPLCVNKSAGWKFSSDLLANDNLRDKTVVKVVDSDPGNEVDKDLVKLPGVDWSTDLEENE